MTYLSFFLANHRSKLSTLFLKDRWTRISSVITSRILNSIRSSPTRLSQIPFSIKTRMRLSSSQLPVKESSSKRVRSNSSSSRTEVWVGMSCSEKSNPRTQWRGYRQRIKMEGPCRSLRDWRWFNPSRPMSRKSINHSHCIVTTRNST